MAWRSESGARLTRLRGPRRLGLPLAVIAAVIALATAALDRFWPREEDWLRLTVVDGDTLQGPGGRYRLHGIDAPEMAQRCEAEGRRYACGQRAREALADLVAGQDLACATIDRDPYGRAVVRCRLRDGTDLGAAMVERGWAMAYRRYGSDYVRQEDVAREARLGLWRGRFEEPSAWRRAN
jgi:endonuclease YncB( thermonuclease family)